MAQIAASNVTYSMVSGSQIANPCDPRNSAIFNVTFGNGTLTYTNGGIPLTKGKLGCPATVQELYFMNTSSNDGYLYKFNHTAETIQIYQAPAQSHSHNFIMKGGVTTTADFLYHSSGALGKAAATDVTITASDVATRGGNVSASLTAAALTEIATSAAVSATTLRMRVVGW